MTARESILDLKQRMDRSILGPETVVERLLLWGRGLPRAR
jgi:hypothetical protein